MTDILEVTYSDDGGHNYVTPRHVPLGEVGDFKREKTLYRLGMTRGRQYEIRYSGDRRCDLIAVGVAVETE